MTSIIPFRQPKRGDPHLETELLLPWYVAGRLDEAEVARVDAHLADCLVCREELETERRLARGLADLPSGADEDWARLRLRLAEREAGGSRRPPTPRAAAMTPRRPPRWIWAAVAAQLSLVVLLGALGYRRLETPSYRTLSAREAQPAEAAVVVVFQPETPERALRQVLQAADARIADGPTGGGGYVLNIPPERRSAALALLRARPEVLLAQPVDAGGGSR